MHNGNLDNKNKLTTDKESDYDSFLSFEVPKVELPEENPVVENIVEEERNSTNKLEMVLYCILAFFIPIVGLILGIIFSSDDKKDLSKPVLISAAIGCGVSVIIASILINPRFKLRF